MSICNCIPQSSEDRQFSVQSDQRKSEILTHIVRKKTKHLRTIPREPFPPHIMTLAESQEFFPDNPHMWLCDGKLLRLLDPENSTNYEIFQVNNTIQLL